jgi:hypothetical protein
MSGLSKLVTFALLALSPAVEGYSLTGVEGSKNNVRPMALGAHDRTSQTTPVKPRSAEPCVTGKYKIGNMRINPETGRVQLCH